MVTTQENKDEKADTQDMKVSTATSSKGEDQGSKDDRLINPKDATKTTMKVTSLEVDLNGKKKSRRATSDIQEIPKDEDGKVDAQVTVSTKSATKKASTQRSRQDAEVAEPGERPQRCIEDLCKASSKILREEERRKLSSAALRALCEAEKTGSVDEVQVWRNYIRQEVLKTDQESEVSDGEDAEVHNDDDEEKFQFYSPEDNSIEARRKRIKQASDAWKDRKESVKKCLPNTLQLRSSKLVKLKYLLKFKPLVR